MPEYIEREAVIKRLEASPLIKNYLIMRGSQNLINGIIDLIKRQPTADVVEVKHGEWQSLDRDHFSCTQCGHIFALGSTATIYNVKQQWQYCPKCGAKLDGKGGCDEID